MSSRFITCYPDTMPGDDDLAFVAKASDVHGGFTVIAAHAVTGAVGTLNLALVNYGSTGTVAGATVATMDDGTATTWAVDTPQALTVTDGNEFIDAGEWLVLKKTESAAGNDLTADAMVQVEVVDGVVDQG